MADSHDRFVECRAGEIETQRNLAALAFLLDRRDNVTLGAERDAVADLDPLAGLGKGLPEIRLAAHMQRRRNLLAAGTFAMPDAFELGGNDLRVVENKRIARLQEGRQIENLPVGQLGRSPGVTTSSLALSRGLAGRNAIFSSGRSKSNRSTRMIRSAIECLGSAFSENAKPAPQVVRSGLHVT